MRPTALALVILTAAIDAFAQSAARPQPPGTQPLEEPPALPAAAGPEPALESAISLRTNEAGDQVEEHRIGGRLYMQRVKPRNGPAYVLIDHRGDGTFTRQDNTLDGGVRVPQWVLLEF